MSSIEVEGISQVEGQDGEERHSGKERRRGIVFKDARFHSRSNVCVDFEHFRDRYHLEKQR
jgi:hypothetical protein